MIFILGGNGFMGGALAAHFQRAGVAAQTIDRSNYEVMQGQSCEVLINANGSSIKYLARQQPLVDFDRNVASVARSLLDFKFKRYIYISSADVYPDSTSVDTTAENTPIDPARQTTYGFHKWLAEQLVRHRASTWLILRGGGFCGPGLTKNALFDVLHGGPLWVSPASAFQILSVDSFAEAVVELMNHGPENQILNLSARGTVSVEEMMQWAGARFAVAPGLPTVRCELNLGELERHWKPPSTIECVQRYIREAQGALPVNLERSAEG